MPPTESKSTDFDHYRIWARKDSRDDGSLILLVGGSHRRRQDDGVNRFAMLLAQDPSLSRFDVGYYTFAIGGRHSLLGRLTTRRQPSFTGIADQLAVRIMADFSAGMLYRQVAVVGFGLGGLVGLSAVQRVLELQGEVGLARIHSLTLIGSPTPASWPAGLGAGLVQKLNVTSRRLQQEWQLNLSIPMLQVLPSEYAGVGLAGVGETNVMVVNKLHSQLAEARSTTDPIYQAVKTFLLTADQQRERLDFATTAPLAVDVATNRLTGLLADETVPFIQVIGMGGTGKSTILKSVLSRLDQTRFRVQQLERPSASAVAAALSSLTSEEQRPEQDAWNIVDPPSLLLVIDDFDSVASDKQVRELLANAVRNQTVDNIIVTGRRAQRLEDDIDIDNIATLRLE